MSCGAAAFVELWSGGVYGFAIACEVDVLECRPRSVASGVDAQPAHLLDDHFHNTTDIYITDGDSTDSL